MKLIFAISKQITSVSGRKISSLIDECQVIRETPQGFRVVHRYIPLGVLYSRKQYAIFDTRLAALEYLAELANRMAGDLEEEKRMTVEVLCMTHDEIRKEKDKGNATGTA